MKLIVPYFKQERETTCGVACLRMVAAFHEKEIRELEWLLSDLKVIEYGIMTLISRVT